MPLSPNAARVLVVGGVGALVALACSLGGLADGTRDASLVGGSAGSAGCTGSGCSGNGGTASCDGSTCTEAAAGSGGAGACADGSRNGSETDVDCGGSCPACVLGRACAKSTDCKSGSCQQQVCACPPDMVFVPTPIPEGLPYCVDPTEVTNEQYDAFLDKNPAASDQPAVCSWNTSFTPPSFNDAVASKPKHPVVNVDWCDARAYCAAAGKRLCGKLGGGSHVYTLPQSATNEWYVACSQAGKNTFVYGNTYDPYACVAEDFFDGGGSSSFQVGSRPKCEGGYDGLVDMNGNVWEWEDSCNDVDGGDASVTACRRRGGAYDDTQYCARCTTCGSATRARNNRSNATGFRCCAG